MGVSRLTLAGLIVLVSFLDIVGGLFLSIIFSSCVFPYTLWLYSIPVAGAGIFAGIFMGRRYAIRGSYRGIQPRFIVRHPWITRRRILGIYLLLTLVFFTSFSYWAWSQSQIPIVQPKTPTELSDVPRYSIPYTGVSWHFHLDIFVNGTHYRIPGLIGWTNKFLSAPTYTIHTWRDESGVVSVASALTQTYMLRQFFEVYGYPQFDSSHIFTFANLPVRVYVNGTLWPVNADDVPLHDLNEIAVVAGSAPLLTIPADYCFPAVMNG